MSQICTELHELLKLGRRFTFQLGYNDIPLNGIYILFEKGEVAHNGDRIVRIGTHIGDNQLRSRIYQHFENENKNRSIFRKNIGRCLLNKQQDPYLTIWELDTTSRVEKAKFAHLINKDFENNLEKEISQYIQDNFSFVTIQANTKQERLYFESKLIGTVSNCADCQPSANWLGLNSPIEKIKKYGLWQVQHLCANSLDMSELELLETKLIK